MIIAALAAATLIGSVLATSVPPGPSTNPTSSAADDPVCFSCSFLDPHDLALVVLPIDPQFKMNTRVRFWIGVRNNSKVPVAISDSPGIMISVTRPNGSGFAKPPPSSHRDAIATCSATAHLLLPGETYFRTYEWTPTEDGYLDLKFTAGTHLASLSGGCMEGTLYISKSSTVSVAR